MALHHPHFRDNQLPLLPLLAKHRRHRQYIRIGERTSSMLLLLLRLLLLSETRQTLPRVRCHQVRSISITQDSKSKVVSNCFHLESYLRRRPAINLSLSLSLSLSHTHTLSLSLTSICIHFTKLTNPTQLNLFIQLHTQTSA